MNTLADRVGATDREFFLLLLPIHLLIIAAATMRCRKGELFTPLSRGRIPVCVRIGFLRNPPGIFSLRSD